MTDYRFPEATRKNNPPAKIAAEGYVPLVPKAEYKYSPRRPPELRFDPTGRTDELPELLATARQRKLTEAEAWALAEALRIHEPWLEWAGKREARSFAVDPVALHIHERVSTQAILKVAAREDVNRSLFADPEQEYNEAVQFYKHDVDWSNRLILGDSLQVMSSLARREDLAGKVQMIYMDPPYGIKFASNFQPEIGKREVKDKESDLTREPEMVKAYRDTWNLGVHSYLGYLRDRVIVAKGLLSDTGSVFVQIGDENVHLVRKILEEVFGKENLCAMIAFSKTSGLTSALLADRCDYLLWFAKDIAQVKYRQLYLNKSLADGSAQNYGWLQFRNGFRRGMGRDERRSPDTVPSGARAYKADNIASQGNPLLPFEFRGRSYTQAWKTNLPGLARLAGAERLHVAANSLQYVRFLEDFSALPVTQLWTDTATGSFTEDKVYVVQTGTKTIERCMLMTTDPGDLVLDATCGSGTTAYVAEE